MKRVSRWSAAVSALMLASAGMAMAQSSSLYVAPAGPASGAVYVQPAPVAEDRMNAELAEVSLVAVPVPEPRAFAVHDLVTIVIRETTHASLESELETEKQSEFGGGVRAFPDLIKFLKFNGLAPALDQEVDLDLDYEHEFQGEGEFSRGETITGRIQAQIADVKPNGTLVLEARKYQQIDDETVTMTLTGTCRAEDITIDNTLLSTQLYDLHLVKTHTGELRRASRKGLFTKVLEFLFNF